MFLLVTGEVFLTVAEGLAYATGHAGQRNLSVHQGAYDTHGNVCVHIPAQQLHIIMYVDLNEHLL